MSKVKLFSAAKSGRKELVEGLLKAGANVNSKDKDGLNPLYFAARNEHQETAVCLVKAGADYNVSDQHGYTPLRFAARNGHRKLVEALVEAGATAGFNDLPTSSPFYLAASRGYCDIAVYLLKTAPETCISGRDDRHGWSPMRFAARYGHKELVEALLQAGDNDIDSYDCHRLNSLYFATLYQHYDVAIYLVNAGASCNVSDQRKWTPLHFAARNGHRKLVEALVKAGADINCKDINRLNPLYFAVESGHYEIAIYLVKAGADCNVIWHWQTPLYLAAKSGQRDLIETLIKGGATPFKVPRFRINISYLKKEVCKVIIKYFLLFNTDSVEPDFSSTDNEELFHFWGICRDQVAELKSTVIGNNKLSILKFLIENDGDKLAHYLMDDCVRENLNKVLAAEKFSVYNKMIKDQFLRGQRKVLLQSIDDLIYKSIFKKLPCEVQNMICSYLSNFDLTNFKKYLELLEASENEKQGGLKRESVVPITGLSKRRKSD